MAMYNNGFPATYQQYYPQYQQPYQMAQPQNSQNMQTPQMNQQQVTPQIQNGGFIPVPNIEVARAFHVSPGTSVTFIDENAPYVYTKTRGFSQLEPPVFEKMRLVKEEDTQISEETDKRIKTMDYVERAEFERLESLFKDIQKDFNKLKEELGGDDDE